MGRSTAANLRLIESKNFYSRHLPISARETLYYPLEKLGNYKGDTRFSPEVVRSLMQIEESSEKNFITTVLIPFASSTNCVLETAIQHKRVIAYDTTASGVTISFAKLFPLTLPECVMSVSVLGLSRPICLDDFFWQNFSPFYDPDTFREIVNLKASLKGKRDKTSVFLTALALDILHGPSAGYLSVPTFKRFAPLPKQQDKLNASKGILPDYRSTAPRLIKHAASLLTDGLPDALNSEGSGARYNQEKRVYLHDGINFSELPSSCVEAVFLAPPMPGQISQQKSWIREWFLDKKEHTFWDINSFTEWLELLSQLLFDTARVLKSKGVVFISIFAERNIKDLPSSLAKRVFMIIKEELKTFFEVEGVYICTEAGKEEQANTRGATEEIIVVRRR
ncbi:MAG: hypothetical protein D6780_02675 [Candidatus Dadabacteria bacterium]|nr:MAG: hypothetical protein D6780_02675 [Candidatus Dadabacteria bacterium]